MTTERQRQANKRNAARSTGPRSAGGKSRASGNALKHGLTTSVASDPAMAEEIARIAMAIGAGSAGLDPVQDDNARIAAEAQLELGRVRAFKAKLSPTQLITADTPAIENPVSAAKPNWRAELEAALREAPQQRRIERYERRAFSRRNRALRKLEVKPIDP